ncbi:hypothetical protein EFR49_01530 [Latilactobacillus curvatus]|nr:hypothetical protein CYK59_03985 [Latilactobacillus curvatus]MCT3528231.1 hypothetical protein [Latilactobacillus curvatus]
MKWLLIMYVLIIFILSVILTVGNYRVIKHIGFTRIESLYGIKKQLIILLSMFGVLIILWSW